MPPEDENDDGAGTSKTVPYERFQRVTAERNEARRELTTAQGRVKELEPYQQKFQDLEKSVGVERARWDQEKTLIGAGLVDAEAQDAARYAYSRMPEQGRAPFGEAVKGWIADPTKAPKILSPFLSVPKDAGRGEEVPGSAAGAGKGAGGKAAPPPSGKAGGGSGGSASAEEIRAAVEHARRTNDWSAYKQLVGRS